MIVVQLDEPRHLTDEELTVLQALLAPEFPGVLELRAQVSDAMVVGRCDCGCPTVNLQVPGSAPPSSVVPKNRLAPYEGRVAALDGEPTGDIILFVDGGYLSCLEYVYYTDNAPPAWPALDRIEVVEVRS
jgi:hypothetical protein